MKTHRQKGHLDAAPHEAPTCPSLGHRSHASASTSVGLSPLAASRTTTDDRCATDVARSPFIWWTPRRLG